MRPTNTYIIGVDLGREVNHSAFAVATVQDATIRFIHLERIPLRTGYLRVLSKLRRLVNRLASRGAGEITIVCDAAGPGQVALELIKEWRPKPIVLPITITGGQSPRETKSGVQTVPRRTLIANLADSLKKNRVFVTTATPHGEHWINELAAIRADGGQCEQDDLAIATALTVWIVGHPGNKNRKKNFPDP